MRGKHACACTEHTGACWVGQGRRISNDSWFNLSRQAPQPLFQLHEQVQVLLRPSGRGAGGVAVSLSHMQASVAVDAPYSGGSCLQFEGG